MAAQAREEPQNIVLLSDGTGNSAAKLMKTNVWRMYEALDLATGHQMAMYDNGVGTSSFRLAAVLGGGLGWGLKRNVRDLYMFACRNYRPAENGRAADQLYAFGFSRGAFTIRVLIGLIQHQGLVTGVRGPELERRAKWAYREYRRQFNATGGLVGPLRTLRDWALRKWERKRTPYDSTRNVRPTVKFMGLWDTVDAYGLPIDEMTRGWDEWIWPLSMCERTRPAIVEKVCHAVALDDERHTFHPVLLDEADEPLHDQTDLEQLTQVWFAGVHSNVGGGYADDSLAHVPLRWMANEAVKKGLRLHPHVTKEWEAKSNSHGPIYDSRGGLGSYYRYNPRSIKKLTDDRFADVTITRPKIHESVFERIKAGRDDYAPIVLPEDYAVVTSGGEILDGAKNPYEHETQSTSRCRDQERVWNLIWLRRILYFATVLLTVFIVLPPFVFSPERGGGLLVWKSRAATAFVDQLGTFVPASLEPWVAYYREFPFQLIIPGAIVILLLFSSTAVQNAIADRMRRVWDAILAPPGRRAVTPSLPPADRVYRFRSHRLYRALFTLVTERVFPPVFGIVTLLMLVLTGVGTVNRVGFALASASGFVCRDVPPENATRLATGGSWKGSFANDELCHSTGVVFEPGSRYQLGVILPGGWYDGRTLVESPAGFSSGQNLAVLPWLPFRRVLTVQWFVPMARIGNHTAEYHSLSEGGVLFSPRREGQLFLFVNDAIGIPPFTRLFYRNNDGQNAIVTVTKLDAPPAASGDNAAR
jgi:uncharacterized protein (DUF2235 family)